VAWISAGLDNIPLVNPSHATVHLLKVNIAAVENDGRQRIATD
jgi:hypothetical protein